MNTLTEEKTEKYIYSLLPARDPVLRAMEKYAAHHNVPIIGPACGRLLYQLARLIRARRVFELGSAIGYSTLWLARAVGPGGVVFYTDYDLANARRAEHYLRRAGVLRRVRLLVGDALRALEATPGKFDLIFNDVDKTQYPEVFRLAVPRLRVGGLLVADNVLRSGHMVRPAARGNPQTRATWRFNRLLYGSPELYTTIIPLREGFSVSQKVRDRQNVGL
jgi:predicted O-methyltransferase YrrM